MITAPEPVKVTFGRLVNGIIINFKKIGAFIKKLSRGIINIFNKTRPISKGEKK